MAMKTSILKLKFNNKKILVKYREDSVGDRSVIAQIFQSLDYYIEHWHQGKALIAYHKIQSVLRPSLIIDAGANIGASTLYFLNVYENSFVFSIEPEKNNWQLLEDNTLSYSQKHNYLGALSDQDGELVLVDPGLSDWGFRTQKQAANNNEHCISEGVKSISPQSILADQKYKNMTPLIFKIDIEGGESDLFSGDSSWMEKFPLIIIELHDWMLPFSGSAKSFIHALAKYDFDFVQRGENLFLFNRKILSK